MSSFFTLPASQKKRKRNDTGPTPSAKKRTADTGPVTKAAPSKPKRSKRDESISGSESDEDDMPKKSTVEDEGSEASSSDSEHEEETAAEKRLRLAERYLANIKDEVQQTGFDAEEIDRDLIAERLKEDVAENKGRLYRHIASSFAFTQATKSPFKANTLCTTSIAICPPYAYTVSKDITLIKWQLPTPALPTKKPTSKNKNPRPLPRRPTKLLSIKGYPHTSSSPDLKHHTAAILTVAASPDGRFVATGGLDKRLIIWSATDLTPLKIFSQHRDAITGLAFRRGTNQLYSSSKDRTIKTWSLNELSYVETLFGHQDEVVDVAALAQERCLSVGARDRTVRLWKVVEETQLVFRGGGSSNTKRGKNHSDYHAEGSIDRVAMIDEELFVTGSDNGSLSLWTIHKKKPVFTIPLAHGLDPALEPEEAFAEEHPSEKVPSPPQPRWITALAAVPYSDLVVSGSWDGWVRVWRVSEDKKKLEAVGTVGKAEVEGTAGSVGVEGERDEAPAGGSKEVEMEDAEDTVGHHHAGTSPREEEKVINGVINDIALFERGDRGQDGLCIVAAIGKEHRLGRWQKVKGRNGAAVFEISKL
ncbi:pre-rRNA processing protein [Trapelia coarctata]|nr:pre-rRNA processing protein [Trapelia coarctata]